MQMNCNSTALRSIRPARAIGAALLLLLMVPLAQGAAAAPASPSASPRAIRVVAGSYPAYCIAVKAAAGLAEVELLGGAGSSPHEHQLSPGDLRRLQSADLVVLIGLGLEPWAARFRASLPRRETPVVVECAAGLGADLIEGDDGHGHGKDGGGNHGQTAGMNPHVWLDPVLAKKSVSAVTKALVKIDAGRQTDFERRRDESLARLDALHHEIEAAAKGFKTRKVVTYHDAFPYFLRRYGLVSAGVIQPQADSSPTPKTLAKLAKRIRDEGIRVIFTEPQFNPRQAERLAKDLGVEIASLDTLETGPLDPRAYEEVQRANLRTLERFLK